MSFLDQLFPQAELFSSQLLNQIIFYQIAFFFGQVIWSVLKLRQFPRLSSRCLHCALMVRKPLTCRRNLTLSHHLPLGHMTLETVVCFSSELEVRLLLTHPSIHPSIHLSIHPSLHPAIQASIHPVCWALA